MSYLATQAQSILEEMFPSNPHRRVFSEHYVKFKGERLFFDFFVRELGVFAECQGQQHTEYVRHFHGDKAGFLKQKYRDNLKIEYIQKNNLYLIRLHYDEQLTRDLVLHKINKAFASEYNFCD